MSGFFEFELTKDGDSYTVKFADDHPLLPATTIFIPRRQVNEKFFESRKFIAMVLDRAERKIKDDLAGSIWGKIRETAKKKNDRTH